MDQDRFLSENQKEGSLNYEVSPTNQKQKPTNAHFNMTHYSFHPLTEAVKLNTQTDVNIIFKSMGAR